MNHFLFMAFLIISFAALGISCKTSSPLGSSTNPLKLMFVPSKDTKNVVIGAHSLGDVFHRISGLYLDADVATSYASAVEAMGAGNIDLAIVPPTGYVMATDRYGAEALLTVVRNTRPYYRGVILYNATMAESMGREVKSIFDLEGTNFLFTEDTSTSGYIYPMLLFRKNGIEPKQFFRRIEFSKGHTQSIFATYLGTDPLRDTFACATYDDARLLKAGEFPDIFDKLKIIGYTPDIPNEVVFTRRGLQKDFEKDRSSGENIRELIRTTFLSMVEDMEGKNIIADTCGIEDFVESNEEWYDSVRNSLYSVSDH